MSEVLKSSGCEQYEDNYDLYVLGSLEEPEAASLAEHLASGCAYCHSQMKQAVGRVGSISQAVPLVAPPAHLRRRLSASLGVAPVARPNRLPWLIATAAAMLLAVMTVWQFRTQLFEREVPRNLAAESTRVSGMLEILAAPGTVELPLADLGNQSLHGALYVHKKLGMAMVVDKLPSAPSGWVYESWVVASNGQTRPIESFDPDAHGRAISVLHGPIEVSDFRRMLISMEPVGSASAKPTKLVFQGAIPRAG